MIERIKKLLKLYERMGVVMEKEDIYKDKEGNITTSSELVRVAVYFDIKDKQKQFSHGEAEEFSQKAQAEMIHKAYYLTKSALDYNYNRKKITKKLYDIYMANAKHLTKPNEYYNWINEVLFELDIISDAKILTFQAIKDEHGVLIGIKQETEKSRETADKKETEKKKTTNFGEEDNEN